MMRWRRRSVLCVQILLLSFNAFADKVEEGKVISNLRELAARLGWPQDIFVGIKGPDKGVQIFGIADIPFAELNQPGEKSYVQWLSGHKGPLQNILDRHLKSYKKLGFYVVPVEGVGRKAYRAFLLSYLARNSKELVLRQSRDAVEIFSGLNLLTLRDERLDSKADAWAIFEEVYESSLEDHYIQPLPQEFPQEPDMKKAFARFPKRILPSELFPTGKALPLNAEGWSLFEIDSKVQLGQLLSFGKRYRYLKRMEEVPSPEVRVFLYAYSSPADAKLAFQLYRKRFKPKEGHRIFVQEIFLCDLRVSWVGVKSGERKELLKSFSTAIQGKIKEIFPSTIHDSRTTSDD